MNEGYGHQSDQNPGTDCNPPWRCRKLPRQPAQRQPDRQGHTCDDQQDQNSAQGFHGPCQYPGRTETDAFNARKNDRLSDGHCPHMRRNCPSDLHQTPVSGTPVRTTGRGAVRSFQVE